MAVVIETTLGDLTVDLFLEQRPRTCLNFLKLCKMKYYNFSLFHSIQSGFIAQTGDPTATGSGGESIWGLLEGEDKRYFTAERVPRIRHSDVGMLSMVCAGDSLVGSQFFFTLGPDLDSLDSMHCVIGVVTEGHDILRQLNEVICDEGYRPYRDVRITHTVVLEDPFDDPKGLCAPSRSPSPSAERLLGGRIAPDEEIDETQGKTLEEINELIEDKEAKARATILEIVGDLPDADVAPPENVLFVCKLNPVTTDSDLEIIFSRFGKIVNCEIIRDRKTGDSLQYAFIEFEDKKSCESAYFKMDNVLIDDRRIHVDFSQSVSKVKYFGKGRVKHMNESDVRNVDVTGDRKRHRSRSKDNDTKSNKERNVNDRKTELRHKSKDRDEKRHYQDSRRKSRSYSRDRHQRNHDRSRRSCDRTRRSRDRNRSPDRHERRRRSRDRDERQKNKNQDRNTEASSDKDQENRKGTEKHRLRRSKSHSPIREPHSSKRGNSHQKTESKVTISQAETSLKDNQSYVNINHFSKCRRDSDGDENKDGDKIGKKSTISKKKSHSEHKNSNDISEGIPSIKQISSKIMEKNKDKYKKEISDLKAKESHKHIQKENKEHNTNDTVKGSKEASKKKLKSKSDTLKKKIELKKKRKHSTSSSSSSDSSSSSSSSESTSSESDHKKKRFTKKKKRHYSTSASSSPSESSSSSESDSSSDSSSTSSSSEGEVRKKRKSLNMKKTPVKKSKINKKNT